MYLYWIALFAVDCILSQGDRGLVDHYTKPNRTQFPIYTRGYLLNLVFVVSPPLMFSLQNLLLHCQRS